MSVELDKKMSGIVFDVRANETTATWRSSRVWREVELILLAAWLGAAIFVVAVVAPSAFAVLPSRALAGALVGRSLAVLNVSGFIIGISLIALTVLELRRSAWFERMMLFVVAFACAFGQWVITARLETLRVAMGKPVDEIAPTDPLRVEFGALHGVSVLVLGVGMLAALVALVLVMRRREINGATN